MSRSFRPQRQRPQHDQAQPQSANVNEGYDVQMEQLTDPLDNIPPHLGVLFVTGRQGRYQDVGTRDSLSVSEGRVEGEEELDQAYIVYLPVTPPPYADEPPDYQEIFPS